MKDLASVHFLKIKRPINVESYTVKIERTLVRTNFTFFSFQIYNDMVQMLARDCTLPRNELLCQLFGGA